MALKKKAYVKPRMGRPATSTAKWSFIAAHWFEEKGYNVPAMILVEIQKMTNPVDKVNALEKLLPYIHPKLTAAEINVTSEPRSMRLDISNEDLMSRAKLILERAVNEPRTIETRVEPISDEAGRDTNSEGCVAGDGIANEDSDGQDQ